MRFPALLWCATAAFAQGTGTLSGTVSSSLSGDPVTGAPIQAMNRTTHAISKAMSTPAGAYSLDLPSGAYDLSVAAPGYNAFAKQNVVISAGRRVVLDIRLLDYQLDTLGDGREFRIELTSPHATPSGPAPRTPEGRPDFSGVWYAQRPVDPGTPEPLPWAEALVKERAANNAKDSPGAHCLPRGITLAGALFPFKLVQTRALLIMLVEDDIPSHRQIFLDGRPHPTDPNPSWMGHSVGHWEGDTLVVDVADNNPMTWLDSSGDFHSDALRVVERYRRTGPDTLQYEATIEDSKVYTRPWKISMTLYRHTEKHAQLYEYECAEYLLDSAKETRK